MPTPTPDSARQPQRDSLGRPNEGWRLLLYTIVFEADTRAGRAFDLTLICLILASVGIVMIDSVEAIHARWGELFTVLEWFFTAI
jgi:voltage-gated potassium channel